MRVNCTASALGTRERYQRKGQVLYVESLLFDGRKVFTFSGLPTVGDIFRDGDGMGALVLILLQKP